MIKKIAIYLNLLILANTTLYSMNNDLDLETQTEENIKIIAALNPWKLLGIEKNSTVEVAQKAYFKLLLKYHPDKKKNEADHDWRFISDNLKPALDNIKGIQIKIIDKYVIMKKLQEILKKDPEDRTLLDGYILGLLRMVGLNEPKSLDFENYGDVAEFLGKNEEKLNMVASKMDQWVKKLNELDRDIYLPVITDGICTLNELYRISALGSTNDAKIRSAAKIGQILHVLSALNMPVALLKIIGI